jgi:CHASE3 domain sensor protein
LNDKNLLSKKLKELKKVIKLQVQKELDSTHKEVKVVSDGVNQMEDVIETLRNKVSE